MKKPSYFLFVILLLITVNITFSQSISPDKIVDIKIIIPHGISSTGLVDAEVILSIKKGWHINANKPLDENLSPTVLSFNENNSVQIQKITYPDPSLKKLSFSDSKLALYEEDVIIKVQIKVNKKSASQGLKLDGTVKYQACNDQTCLFPVSKPLSIVLGPKNKK
jgi:DsbC/DsbD-like thiol-disulfide interchange protein